MNKTSQMIKNRLSLRPPQAKSLEILENITDSLELKNDIDISKELDKVKSQYPTCTDFERDFPSVSFSIATGVGKTRLMGAFLSYLYIEKGIKNFFILAPGTTIYNKLVEDFTNTNSPKYVFRGIAEFVKTPPRVITSDNYSEARPDQGRLFDEVNINIFNIQLITSEMRGGREPKIKRLSEYLGESYFKYLSELNDLVIMMDESHHYRADAGMRAINELKAVLGIEVTATPIDPQGNKFKNVVYEYSLAYALIDGFLKEPAVATRRNFDPSQYRNNEKELDLIKIEDGIRIHEDTKVALDIYSRDTGKPLVKPFVLIVAKDTTHATEIMSLIQSDGFFNGRYKNKVMEIHSNQRGSEKEENIQKLVNLENPDNEVEIVIHVNMLKEGWDVTNLYTIIPLRAANSQILTEQTIGRGLRLPYGYRTGEEKVDKLTVIAHDKFQSIIDAANDPNSIIRKENIIEIDPDEFRQEQTVVTSNTSYEYQLRMEKEEILLIEDSVLRDKQLVNNQAKEFIYRSIGDLKDNVKNISDLGNSHIKKLILENVVQRMESAPQQNLFKEAIIDEMKKEYENVIGEVLDKFIPIPRILIQQSTTTITGFNDFDLDVKNLDFQPVSEEIIRTTLRTNEYEVLQSSSSGIVTDTEQNIIINELINFPEIDYDKNSELLQKLSSKALSKLRMGKTEEETRNIVLYHKRDIAKFIYTQLREHFYIKQDGFEKPIIYPFTEIVKWNFSKYTNDKVYLYTETVSPTNTIPSKVFGGFKKACHDLYKFDSKTEKDFAIILERDSEVQKWLRPAQAQFQIYFDRHSKRYDPDFVVETKDTIYMVEIKKETDIDSKEVQDKAKAAAFYCEQATTYNLSNGGKKWLYAIVPHTEVTLSNSFPELIKRNYYPKNI